MMSRHRQGHDGRPGKNARRWWWIAAVGCALIVGVIAVTTTVFGLGGSDDRDESERERAQKRCETETLNRLISPSTAQLTKVQTELSQLDADSRDLFSLLDEPLKGVDHSRIRVWNVSGVVDAKNDFGGTIKTPFTCRAYFVDSGLAHTLVLLDNH